jgi:hypothetical protein
MMIIIGFEDKSVDIIDKVVANVEEDRLIAEVFTKQALY